MTQLTEADYDINVEVLMANIGIDPGTVAADSAKLQFINGKAVLTYTAMRAIPPNLLAAALLRSHAPEIEQDPPDPEPPAPTPIRRRTAKKTTKKAVAKK